MRLLKTMTTITLIAAWTSGPAATRLSNSSKTS